jgi:membrane protein required for beta-lactamase induction
VPGFILLVELAVLIKPKLFQSMLQQQFSGLVTILVLILVVVVSYTIGLVTRHVGFTAANRISTWRSAASHRSPANAFKHAAADFTAEGIAEALRGLPITVDGKDATPDTLMKGYFWLYCRSRGWMA